MTKQTEQLNAIRENYISPMVAISQSLKTWQLISIFLAICLLGSLLLNVIQSLRNPLILAVDKEGAPELLSITHNRQISDLTDYQVFLTVFVDRLYNWKSSNYKDQIKAALTLMDSNLKNQYLAKLKAGDYETILAKGMLDTKITVKSISSQITKYKDGYKAEILAVKTEPADEGLINTTTKFQIGLRQIPANQENFWGLEVFEIKEEQVAKGVKK